MKFKNLIIFLVMITISPSIYSQEVKDSMSISDIEVVGHNRIHHGIDGDVYVPNSQERKHASDGFSLLTYINYPGLKVDIVEKTISYINAGEIQLRINHIESSIEDLQSILPEQVKNIHFINNPSRKYGNDVAIVIDFICKRNNAGTSAAITTMNALSTNYNDDSGWIKFSSEKYEFGGLYNYRSNSNSEVYSETNQQYHYSTLTPKTITKKGHYDNSLYSLHNIIVGGNITSSNGKHIFDTKLGFNYSGFPERELKEDVFINNTTSTFHTINKIKQYLPSIKLYYFWQIDSMSSLTTYFTGAYIKSKYDRGFFMDNSQNNMYHIDGTKKTFHGELSYSRKMSSYSIVDLGTHFDASRTSNIYMDSLSTPYSIREKEILLYAEHQLALEKFQLRTGIGANCINYNNYGNTNLYWYATPSIIANYTFNEIFSVNYKFDYASYSPDIADLTVYNKIEDLFEITIGNVSLEPYTIKTNELKICADWGNTYFNLTANYKKGHNMIYTITPEFNNFHNSFLFKKKNGGKLHHLKISLYAEQYLFNKKILLYAMPYLSRDIFNTNASINTNTCFSIIAGASLYINDFSFDFDYNSPSESLDSETIIRNTRTTNFCACYKKNAFTIKIGVKNAFDSHGAGTTERRLIDNAPKYQKTYNRAFGNMAYLAVTWNIKSTRNNRKIDTVSTDANLDDGLIK